LDNLKLHYNKTFTTTCATNNHHLIYNAIYSSELNPIERLWALAKRDFGRHLVADSNFKSQAEVRAFVEMSLIKVPRHPLV